MYSVYYIQLYIECILYTSIYSVCYTQLYIQCILYTAIYTVYNIHSIYKVYIIHPTIYTSNLVPN